MKTSFSVCICQHFVVFVHTMSVAHFTRMRSAKCVIFRWFTIATRLIICSKSKSKANANDDHQNCKNHNHHLSKFLFGFLYKYIIWMDWRGCTTSNMIFVFEFEFTLNLNENVYFFLQKNCVLFSFLFRPGSFV